MRFEPLTIPWTGTHTDGPAHPVPWYRMAPVTLAFVAAQVAVCFAIVLAGQDAYGPIASSLAMSPGVLVAEPWRILTYSFVHASWAELWPSCVFVLLMGAALESEIGSVATLQVLVFSAIGGALACAWFTLYDCWGASLALGGIFAALVALPRHRGRRRLLSPRAWWPLVVFVLAHRLLAEDTYPGYEAYLGAFAVGLIYGAAHRPGQPPDVRRLIVHLRQGIAWLALRLGDHRRSRPETAT